MRSRHPERNAAIAKAYRDGDRLQDIADRHGISLSRASYIVKQQGARLSREEISQRYAERSRRIAQDPVIRAKIAETVRRKWECGELRGRKMLFADDPVRRYDYLNLRHAYGAQYAREVMGLAA